MQTVRRSLWLTISIGVVAAGMALCFWAGQQSVAGGAAVGAAGAAVGQPGPAVAGELLLALVLGSLGIWMLRRSAWAPLRALEVAAAQMAAGQLEALPETADSPEVDRILTAFRHMLQALEVGHVALRESEERLNLAVNGVNDGIWDWDLRSNALYLSPKFKEMIGYADHELANAYETFADHLHPDDRPQVLAAIEAYLQGRRAQFSVEFRFRHKDGSWRWILGRGEALRDAQGRPYRMAGSHTDITPLKDLEQTLAARHRELAVILDNSSVGILYIRNRRVQWANRRAGELFGYPPDELPGIDTRVFYLDDTAYAALGEAAYPALARGERYVSEQKMRHRDGRTLWLRISGQAIMEDVRQGSIWVVEDISAQKLTEVALVEAREAAEAASLAKSQFLATMSHEIRTPLNGVLGMAQMLMLPGISEAERVDYARTILGSGQTLLALLNDILDLSKVEAGRLELHVAPFDLRLLLEESLALFAAPAQRRGLNLQLACEVDDEIPFLGDAHRLRQMLANLISNAIKFTEQGDILVAVRVLDRSPSQVLLEWSVRDTGIGVAPEILPRLFQPFSQGNSSLTRQHGGTGLGLSIVQRLASLMGGEVGFESEQGRGSRVWFTVRLAPLAGTSSVPEAVPPAVTLAAAGEVLLQGHVLLVEDDETNRRVIAALLGRLGVRVSEAGDGREAVDRIRSGLAPEVVLMDLRMPELDGYAATRAIRDWERTSAAGQRLPIYALTADAFDEDRLRAREAGMDDVLTKPLSLAALQACLARHLPVLAPPAPSGTVPVASVEAPLQPAGSLDSLLRPLLEALEHSRFGAIAQFRALQAQLAGSPAAGELGTLAPLLDELRFDAVHSGLLRMAKKYAWLP